MWEGQRGKECEESGALFRTRFARAVAALPCFSHLLVNSNVRLLLRRKRLETLKGGCKFELIVRIPKVYSCIFQADWRVRTTTRKTKYYKTKNALWCSSE